MNPLLDDRPPSFNCPLCHKLFAQGTGVTVSITDDLDDTVITAACPSCGARAKLEGTYTLEISGRTYSVTAGARQPP
jgi:transcription elongation factor Elf1